MATNNYAEKIAALLAKAESSTHEAESKIFRDKAQELMIKWGIDDAMVQDAGTEKPEAIVQKHYDFISQWHQGFFSIGLSVVNGLGNMKALISRIDSNKHTRIYIIGHESDVARAITLIASLVPQAESAMKEWWKTERKVNGWLYDSNSSWTAKRQFIISFGHGVNHVLRAQRADLVESGSSTDLVLVSRKVAVDKFYETIKVGKASGRGLQGGSGSARQAGVEAGKRSASGDNKKQIG